MKARIVTEVKAVVFIIILSVIRRLTQLDNGFLKLLAVLFPLSTSSELLQWTWTMTPSLLI